MKLSKKLSTTVSNKKLYIPVIKSLHRFFRDPRNLAIWVCVTLMAANIGLCYTEGMSLSSSLVNLLLPFGVYMLLMGLWCKTGATTLLMLPFMIFAAFQIVLLYLYGGSVIAVDMFLNVVTTNVSEAASLLANLLVAMSIVVVLYIPPLVWAVWSLIKHRYTGSGFRRKMRMCGLICIATGAVLTAISYAFVPRYSFEHETFPVNATSNLVEACSRYRETSHHAELAADFTYHATPTHPDSLPEVYLLVIGETARGDNWQLGGYNRPTNPRLSAENGVVFFHKSISESNTTHKSVPMLISHASAENFDSIAHYKSVITAFREAGFHTAFISNQERNRSYTEHFGNEADTTIYIPTPKGVEHAYDHDLLPKVQSLLADSAHRKQLIVLHTYGSHFRYLDRYPRKFARFTPDQTIDAAKSNRKILINAYDNTILYTDYVLAELIDTLRKTGVRSALLYASDHGEDIFDDSRSRFLHASPVPTCYQIHQATLAWLSPELSREDPAMAEALKANGTKRVAPQKSLFPTIMQLAGVRSPYVTDSLSLVSPRYNPAPPVYLNDLNKTLPLDDCGLTSADMIHLLPLLR